VIKTFFIDFPISVLLGLIFSMFKADLEKDDPFYRFISFWAGLGIWTFYAASTIFAYNQWPYWMWMYHLEPPIITIWGWILIYIVLYGIPFLVGWLIGSHGRKYSWLSITIFSGMSIGGFFIIVYKFWDRFSVIAPSLNYNSEEGISIFNHSGYQEHLLISFGVTASYIIFSYIISKGYYLRQLEKGLIEKQLLHPAKKRALQKIAEAILPEAPDLRKVVGKDLPHLAEDISRNNADWGLLNRIVIRLAIDFINLSPFFYTGKPLRLENLTNEKQAEILERMDRSSFFIVKITLKLIRVFIMLFYYQDQRVLDQLGYTGSSLGIFRKKIRWMNPLSRK
jgi:hypothetical protein